MSLVRLLLVVLITLSASLSSAMDAGHAAVSDPDHTTMSAMSDDQRLCCEDSTERSQSCHVLPALLPVSVLGANAPATGANVFVCSGLLLTGIEPSGPLDPPRAV